MNTVLHTAGWIWGAWVVFNVFMVALCAAVLPARQASFNGFRVIIPAWLPLALTESELAAVIAHECGHRRHLHVWSNLALRCIFLTASAERRRRQEHEADDHAAARGHADALASALRRLSRHPDDLARADRLQRK